METIILNYVWTRTSDLAGKTRDVMETQEVFGCSCLVFDIALVAPHAWHEIALVESSSHLFVEIAETCQACGDHHIDFLNVTSYLCCTISM